VNKPETYTVGELIAALQTYDPGLPVEVELIGYGTDIAKGRTAPIRLEFDAVPRQLVIAAYEEDEDE